MAFLCEGSFVSAFTSLLEQQPSELAIETLEETHLLTLSYAALRELSEGHPCWQRFALGLSAEERYERLLDQWPGIELRVPQYHIASYLGVAPETLSRLRSRRAKRAQRTGTPRAGRA